MFHKLDLELLWRMIQHIQAMFGSLIERHSFDHFREGIGVRLTKIMGAFLLDMDRL